jgi:hypothetical protein
MPDPILRVSHRRVADAPPWALWESAATVRLEDCRVLGRLVRWRIPGLSARLTYRELFSHEPFVLLDEDECALLSGVCGRIWTRRRDHVRLDGPEDFMECREPGIARVLFAHWVEPIGRHRAALVSQVEIAAHDRSARRGVALVRPLIAAFGHLIDREPLAVAAWRAEERQLGSRIR